MGSVSILKTDNYYSKKVKFNKIKFGFAKFTNLAFRGYFIHKKGKRRTFSHPALNKTDWNHIKCKKLMNSEKQYSESSLAYSQD
jgi:hypothetical protein